MKNPYLKKIIAVASCAALAVLFIVTLFFCTPELAAVPETSGSVSYYGRAEKPDGTDEWAQQTVEIGNDFTAVRIIDLGDLCKLTKVNYVADKFVQPGLPKEGYTIVDLTKPFEFAEKGTLAFAVMSLDSFSEDFDEQSEALSKYKMGENWCFTVKLPQIFSASNVYYGGRLVARNGEIENYNFSEYNTNYVKNTESFSAQTEPIYVDLQFYTKREAIANAYITIHYQSTGTAYSGIADCPIIGTESAVKSVNKTSEGLLNAFGIIAAVVFAVLVVLSFIERSAKFVSAIVWVFGITVMLLSKYYLCGVTTAPLFWSAAALAMPFVVLGGALLAMGINIGKVPVKYIFPALCAVGGLFAFICPFIPLSAASPMSIVCTVIKAICASALIGFIGFTLFNKKDGHGVLQSCCAALISVLTIASLCLPQILFAQTDPLFWLYAIVTVATFVNVISVITDMKRSNVYLTNNLHLEVERQVKDIKSVIADRDKLLQFVSHDMKKPLSSSIRLCDTALQRETDEEQIKTIGIIKQDTMRVINDLSEIAAYAKLNYLAEPSQVVDMSELCALLYRYHKFDCDANGIILKTAADSPVKAFVKPKGVENVVSNIIINAIEHAHCKTITLAVKSEKNKVVLCVADDGKGINNEIDVFQPYVSENDNETGGLGLYICKNIIESMNGELTYNSDKNGTVFYISLLKA